jgi:uncharacterized protein
VTTAIRDEILLPSRRPVAPLWHTAVLVAFFLALTAAGALYPRASGAPSPTSAARPSHAPLYLSLIVGEWGLFFYVARAGLRRAGTRPRDLIGGGWRSGMEVLRDLGLGLALWGVWTLAGWASSRWLGHHHPSSIRQLLPRGGLEAMLWIALSTSAGICEEFVFRGYFLRQFEALTGSRWVALIAQAALFGISHGYQGVTACVHIAAYGMLFGVFATWRGSLRPGMIAHAWTDVAAGLLGI